MYIANTVELFPHKMQVQQSLTSGTYVTLPIEWLNDNARFHLKNFYYETGASWHLLAPGSPTSPGKILSFLSLSKISKTKASPIDPRTVNHIQLGIGTWLYRYNHGWRLEAKVGWLSPKVQYTEATQQGPPPVLRAPTAVTSVFVSYYPCFHCP